MVKPIKSMGAERAAKLAENQNKPMKRFWNMSRSINVARNNAGRKQIYRLPSGVYLWRK